MSSIQPAMLQGMNVVIRELPPSGAKLRPVRQPL